MWGLAALIVAQAAQGPLIAVLEFKSELGGAERKAVSVRYLADTVRSAALEALPGAQVITRENMLVLLASSGRKLEECEGECEVDTGRRLGAELVVSGDLLKFGSNYKLDLRLHDTRNGRLLAGAQASGKTADELDAALAPAVAKLFGPVKGTAERGGKEREQDEQRVQGGPRLAEFTQVAGLRKGDTEEKVRGLYGEPERVSREANGAHLYYAVPKSSSIGKAGLDVSLYSAKDSTNRVTEIAVQTNAVQLVSRNDPKIARILGRKKEEALAGLGTPVSTGSEYYRYALEDALIGITCLKINDFVCSRIAISWPP